MRTSTTLSLSILSGKGGVGKSNLALNLCQGLFESGQSVLLMDCDMGLANMDVLLGIAPQMHVQDILLSDKDAEEILVPVASTGLAGVRGFDLLPANSGMAEFSEIDSGARAILREKLNPLASKYDFLVLDIGAGISPTALEFGAMTMMRVVVVTPEPTSLTDSYALMKVLANRHGLKDFYILVNQVESAAEGKQTYSRLASACNRFLGFTPTHLGDVRFDRALGEAVRKQRPLLQVAPRSPAALDCKAVASAISRLRDGRKPRPEALPPLRDMYAQVQVDAALVDGL